MKKLLIFLVLVALGLAGLAAYTKHAGRRATEDDFKSAKVDFGDMRDIVGVQAVLSPKDVRPVLSMISGQVMDVPVKVGVEVEEGQVLVQLDQRDAGHKRAQAAAAVRVAVAGVAMATSALAKAKAGGDVAQNAIDATKELPVGTVQKVQLEGALSIAVQNIKMAETALTSAEAQRELAEAKLKEAEFGLEVTTIRVPGSETAGNGPNDRPKRKFTVLDRKVEPGQNVDNKQILFLLASNMKAMQAHALVPESQIDRVAKGQKAEFWVESLGEEKKKPAEVAEIGLKAVNQQGATAFNVLLNVENVKNDKTGEWQLKPGMTAQVEITDRTHHGVWKLPVNAMGFTLEDDFQTPEAKKEAAEAEKRLNMSIWSKIWIFRDGKPWPVFVRIGGVNAKRETGIKDAEYYEILEWDAETKPDFDPNNRDTYPDVIIGAPPKKGGLFDLAPIKL